MSLMSKRFISIILSLPFLFSSFLLASELNLSGFGTLGGVYTDTDGYRYRTDMSQNYGAEKDEFRIGPVSQLGVQLHAIWNDQWDFVGQLNYREQDKYRFQDLTQLAFVRYKPDPRWRFRVGRTAIDSFHLSDVRDIGIAYPWVVVPNEVYGLAPNRELDGVDVSYVIDEGIKIYEFKLFAGETQSDFSSTTYSPIHFDDLFGGKFEVNALEWQFAVRYTHAKTSNNTRALGELLTVIPNLEPIMPGVTAFSEQINFKNKSVSYLSLFGRKNIGVIEASIELAFVDSDVLPIKDLSNGYINLIYPMKHQQFYFTYSKTKSDPYYYDGSVAEVPAALATRHVIEEFVSTFRHNQKSYSLGWRYDWSENLAVKLQLQHTEVSERGGGLQITSFDLINGDQDTFTKVFAAVSFSF